MKTKRALYIITFCLLIIIIGLGYMNSPENLNNGRQNINDSITTMNKVSTEEQTVDKDEKTIPIILYFLDIQEGNLHSEKRMVKKSEILNNMEETILNELIKGPQNEKFVSTIPNGTKVLSVKKENNMVIVNFSKEFIINHPGGSMAETVTIYSIVNSLTEIKEIEKVKFLIEGEEKEEYKGHYQFNIPFQRDEGLIALS